MKTIKQCLKEMKAGRNLEEYLPRFCNLLSGGYYEYELLQYAMNYFTFYEINQEKENPYLAEGKFLADEIHKLTKEILFLEFDAGRIEDCIKRCEEVRSQIIKKMQILTAYTDMMQVYEYVLNRVEKKYMGKQPEPDIQEVSQQILQYIFETEDNPSIHEKIKEIIGQLPVRVAKSKYFDLIRNSFTIYNGADCSSVENYIYMLETSAMIRNVDGIDTEFLDLKETISVFANADFKQLQAKEFESLRSLLKDKAKKIRFLVDMFVMLQELTNTLYALAVLKPYVLTAESKIETNCMEIIREINKCFIFEGFSVDLHKTSKKFELTEGRLEELGFEIGSIENTLFETFQNNKPLVKSLLLEPISNCLIRSQKLMSSSLFMDLKETGRAQADEVFIKQAAEGFIAKLEHQFKRQNILVNRAVMANTLNKIPVFFQRAEDVSDYVSAALSSCSDAAELAACIEIINQIIAD